MIAVSRRITCSVLTVLSGVDWMKRETLLCGGLTSGLMILHLDHNLLVPTRWTPCRG